MPIDYKKTDKDLYLPKTSPSIIDVPEDEYILSEEKTLLEKFGSAKTLALAMVRNGHLTDSDVEDLRDYFKNGGEGK